MLSKLEILVTLCYCVTMVTSQLIWELLFNNSMKGPPARKDMALGYFPHRRQLILFGGRSPFRDDTWIYDLIKGKWRIVENLGRKPPGRSNMVYGVSENFFYIACGQSIAGDYYSDLWRFDITTERWIEMPTSLISPESRYGAVGGIYPDSHQFVIAEGYSHYHHSDVFVYDLISENWTEAFPERHSYSPSYPHARYKHSGTMLDNNTLIIYGGCLSGGGSGGPCPSGDSWAFFLDKKQWKKLHHCASPRTLSAMAVLPSVTGENNQILLYGGKETSSQILSPVISSPEEVAILDPQTWTWQLKRTQGQVPSKRHSMAMVTAENGIFMFGGEDSNGLLHELWFLNGTAEHATKAPDSSSCAYFTFSLIYLHGIFMILGWGVFIQLGALIARYMRESDPLWFHLHRAFQIIGLLLAFAGLVCAIISVDSDHFKFLHGILGLVIMFQGLQQVINAIIRPHKPPVGYPIPLCRQIWEFFHKLLGRITLILAIVNICLGVFLGVTHYIFWIIWYLYFFILVIVYLGLEIKKCQEERSLYRRRRRLSASNEMW